MFKIEVIQPLLDMATGSGSATGMSDVDQAGPNGGERFADASAVPKLAAGSSCCHKAQSWLSAAEGDPLMMAQERFHGA